MFIRAKSLIKLNKKMIGYNIFFYHQVVSIIMDGNLICLNTYAKHNVCNSKNNGIYFLLNDTINFCNFSRQQNQTKIRTLRACIVFYRNAFLNTAQSLTNQIVLHFQPIRKPKGIMQLRLERKAYMGLIHLCNFKISILIIFFS